MLVAIEGIDGSGKKTQATLLLERARAAGRTVASFAFPRYGSGVFAALIARYLNGEFGPSSAVPAELAALMYAGDRFAARDELARALDTADLVVCDRYVASNLAHQGAKLPPERRDEFLRWAGELEYGLYRLPAPDVTVHLDIPADVAVSLVARKPARDYTPLKADIHERDAAYLAACAEVYRDLAGRAVGGRWVSVRCADAGRLREPHDVARDVWSAVGLPV